MHSWQAHLKRISSYLVNSKVWWDQTANGFIFKDGDLDVDFRPEGPFLSHFRSASIKSIERKSNEIWTTILQDKTEIPISLIRLYDDSGNYVTSVSGTGLEPMDVDMTGNGESESVNIENNDTVTPSRVDVTHPPITSTPTCSTPSNSVLNDISVSPINQVDNVSTPIREVVKSKPMRLTKETLPAVEEETEYQVALEYEDDGPSSSSNSHDLVSKNAKVLESLLGPSKDLSCLDQLRTQLKFGVKKKQLYVTMLAEFQVRVLKLKSDVSEELKSVEQDYYRQHGELPGKDNQIYYNLSRKLKKVKVLLRSWNMF